MQTLRSFDLQGRKCVSVLLSTALRETDSHAGRQSVCLGKITIKSIMKIKKGDKVIVITGKDKGKTGSILLALPKTEQVVIDGVHVVTRHQKSKQSRSQGQIIQKSMPIHVSNVALVGEGNKAVRAGYTVEKEGDKSKKVRVARPTGKKI